MRHLIQLTLLATSAVVLSAAQTPAAEPLNITVNSNADNIQADQVITLREAIALTNGDLNYEKLTRAEKSQITRSIIVNDQDWYHGKVRSHVKFALPQDQTQIRIQTSLPAIQTDGTIIDGTSQLSSQQTPLISLAPATNVPIMRGLHIKASGVTVKGLSFTGFGDIGLQTYQEPAGDIVIGQWETNDAPEQVVQDVVIAQNWLGTSRHLPLPNAFRSGFGVYIFNGQQIEIRDNWITQQRGSGIITGKTATNLYIHGNRINQNGQFGMADGIRLEGNIDRTNIQNNEINANSGSGIYLFKPQGRVTIAQNKIRNTAATRAAIYLMGNGHEVRQNNIKSVGSGVIIAAYPRSRRNQIRQNRFQTQNGLSVDLVSQRHVGVNHYFQGDGRNLATANYPSHWDFANGGIDAPQFLSREFIIGLDGTVEIRGKAMPNATIELYRTTSDQAGHAVLSQPLNTVTTDARGQFQITLGTLKATERISATVSHPDYGTSEASRSSVIRAID
ncbi:right-handed parallel beta-helix repeat-containing protein [filamentous cyanobacterium LEGE 11480]|uniref:Right-handed parallel beta-helix repeat-containing protein n=1 Tax=Romeriopsis navalis LEGE 11480 TaxID=2777977 RepID=A0A928VK47_9CYAN|nr:right-handed parallel beta-helix repeat-containing protein [Romeriopsis navalis]MBE9030088.1 right-handed parallel beta-helix repeat-containing protein [Romeriopsis navalis LEGE 11480]